MDFSVTNALNSSFPIFPCRCLQSRAWAGSLLRLPPRFAGSAANGQRGLGFFPPNNCWPTKMLKNRAWIYNKTFSLWHLSTKKIHPTSPHLWLLKLLHRSRCDHQGFVSTSDEQHGGPKVPGTPVLLHTSHPLGPPKIQAGIRNITRAYLSSRLVVLKKVSIFFHLESSGWCWFNPSNHLPPPRFPSECLRSRSDVKTLHKRNCTYKSKCCCNFQ